MAGFPEVSRSSGYRDVNVGAASTTTGKPQGNNGVPAANGETPVTEIDTKSKYQVTNHAGSSFEPTVPFTQKKGEPEEHVGSGIASLAAFALALAGGSAESLDAVQQSLTKQVAYMERHGTAYDSNIFGGMSEPKKSELQQQLEKDAKKNEKEQQV